MARSRLQKRLERKTKLNLFLSIVGILAILIVIIKFGVPIAADLGLFLSGNKASEEDTKKDTFISPPILDSMPSATNSAQIKITGKAEKNSEVEIYINGLLEDTVGTDEKGNFSTLKSIETGTNTIKARINKDGKKSSYSTEETISFRKAAPNITIDAPSDGQKFEKDRKTANVTGKTDTESNVTINGFLAVTDGNLNFSYSLPLKDGDNEIKVVATDQAGNKSEKTIKVSYSP